MSSSEPAHPAHKQESTKSKNRKRGEKPEFCDGIPYSKGKNKPCDNEKCKHAPDGKRAAQAPSKKAWVKYCCKVCGDAARRRDYYKEHKDDKKSQ